jgi:FtsP/CotA-like multicopper oxidase with cupredoxin domain
MRPLQVFAVLTVAALAQGARADGVPTGLAPSPTFGVQKFTQPMPRFDLLGRNAMATMNPAPTELSNQTLQAIDTALGGGMGPVEGRPPTAVWAHQGFTDFPPAIAVEVTMEGAKVNTSYNPGVSQALNSQINPALPFPPRFHPKLPDQGPLALWTFNGTLPPKLLQVRYAEPVLFREHNKLPVDKAQNGGFGIHSISTHEHNGHHGAENDGFTGAYFFPNQFYDYFWPVVLAGFRSINPNATDPMAGTPDDAFGRRNVAGDWHETMSTHWFHDHMFSFTSQNVYKGMAAMMNIYSALDRGSEGVIDGVNLRLPSGTARSWGNLDYDVNLVLADKAWDAKGQLAFDKFEFDGFLGDRMTVNLVDNPYFEVEARKYRFRILNGAVSRFFKLALSDGSTMIQIGNDGNLLPHPVPLTELDEQGIAERYDVVIDFSRYRVGSKVYFVNLAKQTNGRAPDEDLSLQQALKGDPDDPVVGKFLEFRVVRQPAYPDMSQVPDPMIPNPTLPTVVHNRSFGFDRGGFQTKVSQSSFNGPWGVQTDDRGGSLDADYGRISAAPGRNVANSTEQWTLANGGGGWDHPVHIHFEEGQIVARNGSANNVPAWEKGRKDVYRLRPGGSVTLRMQFRDWGGMFMEHCHNTVHEDNAMLVRWEIDAYGGAFLQPLPTPMSSPQGYTFVSPDSLSTAYNK